MPQLFRLAAITDEFSPDIEKSVASMAEIGMTGAELRMLFGKNIIDLSDAELDRAKQICASAGMQNEHACNIATATETLRVLAAIDHPHLKVVWDPANCYVSGEIPYPQGYRKLPVSRIVHVHVKDCHVEGHKPIWGPVGEGGIDWRGQIAALAADGYTGWVSLETHWPGPGNDKHLASMICGR